MCCKGFLKVMMFVFNGIIFLAGAAVLAVGIWVAVDRVSLLGFLEHIEDAPPELAQLANIGYLLIGVGAFLAIMGFLGCCGAVKESKCMLLTVQETLNEIGQKVAKSIKDNYGKDEPFSSIWNTTMNELNCCGYNNYTDFSGSNFVEETSMYPEKCCSSGSQRCDERAAEIADIEGCFRTLVKLIEDNALLLAGVALGIAALEIAAMVVSMILYKNVGK